MAEETEKLFNRLTRLFRSGPVVKRKIRGFKSADVKSSALDVFRKSTASAYGNGMNAFGALDRLSRYSDFSEMEFSPEIASALTIYAEETATQDEKGKILHVFSENPKVKELLEELFYDTLNVEFSLISWIRNLCKYGDFFLFLDVSEQYGVINAFPVPVNEIEREEHFDPNDPMAIRFRWVTQGNQYLENWQIAHFRLLGSDQFIPYGSSILDSARRIWRQLILLEDSMLVYRVIRSPERRVFYIDVGNAPPEEVSHMVEAARANLKTNSVIDKDTGKVDLRYAPMSVDADYFIPIRNEQKNTRIETLAGGINATAIDDVEYIHDKLFSALKVPKPYLGFSEQLSSKANLAQEDVRFSRAIQAIQKVIISELNKIAIIHLFSNGYSGDDLLDFTLSLNNPSAVAQQQKLELIARKFEIAGTRPEGMLSEEWIYKHVFGLTDQQIIDIQDQQIKELKFNMKKEALGAESEEGGGAGGGGGGLGGGMGGGSKSSGPAIEDVFGGDSEEGGEEAKTPETDEEGGGDEEDKEIPDEENIFAGEDDDDLDRDQLLIDDEDDYFDLSETEKGKAPIKPQHLTQLQKLRHNRQRLLQHRGPHKLSMPDLYSMNSLDSKTHDINDREFSRSSFKEAYAHILKNKELYPESDIVSDSFVKHPARMSRELNHIFKSMDSKLNINKGSVVLSEGINEEEDELELEIEDDTEIDINLSSED